MSRTYKQNAVATTWEQNIAAAKVCGTFNEAVSLFRALQYANDMGTHGGHFDELEEHFINKLGFTATPQGSTPEAGLSKSRHGREKLSEFY